MSHSVTIYQHSGFNGASHDLGVGEFPTMPTVGNDRISSIKVAKGYYVKLFISQGFQKQSIYLFEGNYGTLPSWGDAIGSAKVFKNNETFFPIVTFYENSKFKGYAQTLAATGRESGYESPFFRHDTISSIKVPEGTSIELFEHSNFNGNSLVLKTGNHESLSVYGWDNKVSSVKIRSADLILINIEYGEERPGAEGSPVAISNTTVNKSDIDQVSSVTISKELSHATTRSWEESTMEGISASVTSAVIAEGPVFSAEVSATIGSTLEKTFTIGEEKTNEESFTFENTVNIQTPANSIGRVSLILTPKKYEVDVIYTFELKGTDKREIQKATIYVDTYLEGEAIIETVPIGQKFSELVF